MAVCRPCFGEACSATWAVADVAAGAVEDSAVVALVVEVLAAAEVDLAVVLVEVVTLVAEVRAAVGNPYNRWLNHG